MAMVVSERFLSPKNVYSTSHGDPSLKKRPLLEISASGINAGLGLRPFSLLLCFVNASDVIL